MHTNVLVPKLRMTKWLALLLFMTLILFAVSPVQAAPSVKTIEAGDNVFIGEQGLDVSLALNGATAVARWAPGADRTIDQPDRIVQVPLVDQGNFNIGTANFRGFEGPYYQWTGTPPGGNFTFQVSEPSIAVVLHDTQGVVSSGSNRYLGTKINFEIQTNLNSIVNQRDSSAKIISLNARSPNGITYTSLFTSDSVIIPIINLVVDTNPWFWSPTVSSNYWDTASKSDQLTLRYPQGAYSIWAESFINGMNVISANQQLNLIAETLTITSPASVTRSNQFTVNVTGRPNTTYTLFIMDNPCNPMDGYECHQPPMILDGQKGVEFDPKLVQDEFVTYPIASELVYPALCKDNTRIMNITPHYPYNGTRYYANVTTDETGVISVGFTTSAWTAIKTFTIHVQGMGIDGLPKYADTTTAVNMGAVTLTMPDTAILGETVPMSGSNTDSFTTYLYLTGPCQPNCGSKLDNPDIAAVTGVESTFTWLNVTNYDRTWVYNPINKGWETKNLKIQPGVYTIYATSKPVNACDLSTTCVAYTTRVITLLEPTLTATIIPETLIREGCTACGGQCVVINGHTTGNSLHQIQYWVFGEQKIGDKHYYNGTIEDCCGDFEIDLCDVIPDFDNIPAGKYYVVLQHPMYNHVFDVFIEGNYQGNSAYTPPSTVIGEQNKLYVISSAPIRWSKMFPIEGADAKREIDALNALIQALNDPGIDDIYITLNFTVKDSNAPTASFAGSPTSGSAPLGVQFTDTSLGSPTSWAWEFGDGTTSTEQFPYHIYSQIGDYSVKLTASKVVNSKTYSDSITQTNYISVGAVPLQAAFTGTPRNGQSPLNVQFTDQSTGTPTSWFWDFGDGQYSSVQNPSHTYATAGSFAVTLTASKLGVSNSLTVPGYIVVSGVPTTTPTPTPTPVPYDRITLSPGWNFVSTPKLLASGYNTGAIFSNVDMGGRSAWIWDGSKTPPQWVPVISTTPVQPLYGIWIYSVSNTVVNLNFDTNLNSPPTRSLPAGWNSIGFTGVTQQPARNTYLSVKPNWTQSMGFNSAMQKYEATIFNGDPQTEYTVQYPTKGYWLYMMTPGNLAAIGA